MNDPRKDQKKKKKGDCSKQLYIHNVPTDDVENTYATN